MLIGTIWRWFVQQTHFLLAGIIYYRGQRVLTNALISDKILVVSD